jgi:hypothetical protein
MADIQLARFVLWAPNVLLSYWFISADFADLLGVEFSKEAAKRIKDVLGGTGARVDYEADAVTIRISGNPKVIPALRQLYAAVGWDTAELDEAEPRVLAFRRPKPKAIAPGNVFLVPIMAALHGAGQILAMHGKSPTVGIFRWSGSREQGARLSVNELRPLTVLHTNGPSLRSGDWPIIGTQAVALDANSGPGGRYLSIGSTSYGGDGPVVKLLRAFAGLDTWEQDFHDPAYLRNLVME